jgi:hypothetical protein
MVDASKHPLNAGAAEPGVSDVGLTLGRDIYARYGVSPGMIASPAVFGLARQTALFGMERLPLLALIQRRFGGSSILPSGWPALHFVWALNRSVRRPTRPPGVVVGRTASGIARAVTTEVSTQPGSSSSGTAPADSHAAAAASTVAPNEVRSSPGLSESSTTIERTSDSIERASAEGLATPGNRSTLPRAPSQDAPEPRGGDVPVLPPNHASQVEASVLRQHVTGDVVSPTPGEMHPSAAEENSSAGDSSASSLQPTQVHDIPSVAGEGRISATATVGRTFEFAAIHRQPESTHDVEALPRSTGSADLTPSESATADSDVRGKASRPQAEPGSAAFPAIAAKAEATPVQSAPRMITRMPSAVSSCSAPMRKAVEPHVAHGAGASGSRRSELTSDAALLVERASDGSRLDPRSSPSERYSTIPSSTMQRPILARNPRGALSSSVPRELASSGAAVSSASTGADSVVDPPGKLGANQDSGGDATTKGVAGAAPLPLPLRTSSTGMIARKGGDDAATTRVSANVDCATGSATLVASQGSTGDASTTMGAAGMTPLKSHLRTGSSETIARKPGDDAATTRVYARAHSAAGSATLVARHGSTDASARMGAAGMTPLKSHLLTSPNAPRATSLSGQNIAQRLRDEAVSSRVSPAPEIATASPSAGMFLPDDMSGKLVVGGETELAHRHPGNAVVRLPAAVADTSEIAENVVARSANPPALAHEIGTFSNGEKSSPGASPGTSATSNPETGAKSTATVVQAIAAPLSARSAFLGRAFEYARHFTPEFSWRRPGTAESSTEPWPMHRAAVLLASRSEASDASPTACRATSAPLTHFAPRRVVAGQPAVAMPASFLMPTSLMSTSLMSGSGVQRSPSGVGSGSAGTTPGLSGPPELPTLSAFANTAPKGPELNQLANRVYELLVKRLASERQRRGF